MLINYTTELLISNNIGFETWSAPASLGYHHGPPGQVCSLRQWTKTIYRFTMYKIDPFFLHFNFVVYTAL